MPHPGKSPQPGLALLHLRGGDVSATASLRQALELEQWNILARSRLLAAQVDIALAAGDPPAAGAAAGELSSLAVGFPTVGLAATSHYAEGIVALADHRPAAAIPPLRLSWRQWREIGVTHEAARARLKLGSALCADGQDAAGRLEGAAWELVIEGESYRHREKPTLEPSPAPGRRRGT